MRAVQLIRRSTLKNPAIRWIAVALLVFAQISYAGHYHELGELASHDCTVCSQLSTVENGSTGHASAPPFPPAQAIAKVADQAGARISFCSLLPPSRAPPFL
jgi:hypothetical protein